MLELPAVRERVHRLSVAEYHRAGETGVLSEDVELLRGLVVTKMPRTPLHEFVAQKLTDLLLAKVPAGFKVWVERPLTLRDSEPEPDLSVVRGQTEDWVTAHPSTAALVVEVAVSSASVDEGKADIYAEAGIPEYWLVRPDRRAVEVYREPDPGGYLLPSTLTERDTLDCATLGVEFPISDILPPRS